MAKKETKPQAPSLVAAAAKIASMLHPSIPAILRKRGFGYEADRVQELMDAYAAESPVSDIVITFCGDPPKIECSAADRKRIKLVETEELLYMEHHGVKVYYTLNQGCASDNWFSTEQDLSNDCDNPNMFDIREIAWPPARAHNRLRKVFGLDDDKCRVAYAIEQGKISLDALV